MNLNNLETSVHQKLLLIARESKRDFNSVLLGYIQERFLYRLSKSDYKNTFILKGALLFSAFNIPSLRPTKDIDFLGISGSNNLEDIKEIIKEICMVEYEDAVFFETDSIKVKTITKNKENLGVRARITAKLGTARIILWLDFGFGDKIVDGPVGIDFPVLLNFEAPRINVYSLESAIAEKFEACVKLNFVSSRMKDFYDINELAAQNNFNLLILRRAIKETFSTRGTNINSRNVIFSNNFKNDAKKEIQWKAFLKRTSIVSKFSFNEVIERIESFIEESCGKGIKNKNWDKNLWLWK